MTAPSPRPDVLAVLDQLDALREAATPGPWEAAGPSAAGIEGAEGLFVATAAMPSDAALIVAAVNALPRLTAVARAVHALAERHERSAAHRRRLAERWMEAGRHQLADAFRRLAHQSEVEGARLRAVLAALTPDTTTEKASKA